MLPNHPVALPACHSTACHLLPVTAVSSVSCSAGGATGTEIERGLWAITGAPLQNRLPRTQGGPNMVANGVSCWCCSNIATDSWRCDNSFTVAHHGCGHLQLWLASHTAGC